MLVTMNKFPIIFAVQNKFVGLLIFVIYLYIFCYFFAVHFNGTYIIVWGGMSFWPFMLPKLILLFLWLH